MPAGMPDLSRIQQNARVIFAGAGETAQLFTYASTTSGTPKFGVADYYNYVTATITGLFAVKPQAPYDTNMPGGATQNAKLMVTTDRQIGPRDLLTWRGTSYRMDGSPMPENLGGRALWHTPLGYANPTG